MKFGMIISDVPRDVDPVEQLDGILRQVEAGQRNGLSHFVIGQHFLYGDLRWLQPVPLLARLAAEVDEHVRLAITVVLAPLYNPVILAEELATLDIVTRGMLDVGLGLGYRTDEFGLLNVPFAQRVSRFDECLDIMKRCWAMEDFDYRGRHWQIEAATPH
ncbi:MAG: LLM class flavin-dependent oxidoreductase, partial [Acidimicrobiia bacterium]